MHLIYIEQISARSSIEYFKYFKNQNFLKENIKIEYSKNSLTKIKKKNKSNKILKAVFVVTTTNENFFISAHK